VYLLEVLGYGVGCRRSCAVVIEVNRFLVPVFKYGFFLFSGATCLLVEVMQRVGGKLGFLSEL